MNQDSCEVFDKTTIVYRAFIPRCAPDNNQCLVLEFESLNVKSQAYKEVQTMNSFF